MCLPCSIAMAPRCPIPGHPHGPTVLLCPLLGSPASVTVPCLRALEWQGVGAKTATAQRCLAKELYSFLCSEPWRVTCTQQAHLALRSLSLVTPRAWLCLLSGWYVQLETPEGQLRLTCSGRLAGT